MNKLFAELYLDENMSVLVAEILRARGVSVLTTREAGRLGSSDDDQLRFATAHGRAIVTMDRGDFESLAKEFFTSERSHAGIFIVNDNPPQVIASRLAYFLDLNTADEMADQVIYI